jgi:hypothetical protein
MRIKADRFSPVYDDDKPRLLTPSSKGRQYAFVVVFLRVNRYCS